MIVKKSWFDCFYYKTTEATHLEILKKTKNKVICNKQDTKCYLTIVFKPNTAKLRI